MEAIAAELNLSREQLEDRVVPDCGLDEHGSHIFDFGPRQFRLGLGAGLEPFFTDSSGYRIPDLPKANRQDDPAKAKEAIAAWKLMKKQLAEVTRVQTRRLEQALITQRRWSATEFRQLFLRHPFLVNLAPSLVWGAYDTDSMLLLTFRVAEDRSLADQHDSPADLPSDAAVGIVHPMQLVPETLAAWSQLLADYKILPPFPQLGRPIMRLEACEAAADSITRYAEACIPATALVGGFAQLGWRRSIPADAGGYDHHAKDFPSAGVHAVVEHETIYIGTPLAEADPSPLAECYFRAGAYDRCDPYTRDENKIRLSEIDPLLLSEVLNDLRTVASHTVE